MWEVSTASRKEGEGHHACSPVCAHMCADGWGICRVAVAVCRTQATGRVVTRLWTWFPTLNELRGVTASDLHFTKTLRVDLVDCLVPGCLQLFRQELES